MPDTDSLDRFLAAQATSYSSALAELRAGSKQTHWMWFVLPQLRGLGFSAKSHYYGLADAQEALDYVGHPVLGPRLVACVEALLDHADLGASEIMGKVDALKLHSCLTLFARVAPETPCFTAALRAFFAGEPDAATLRLLKPRSTGRKRGGRTSRPVP